MDSLVFPSPILSLVGCTCMITNALGKTVAYTCCATQAMARYEILHLTEEDHKLEPPVGCPNTQELLTPTQLHESFC